MKCSICQFDNPEGMNFCGKCGSPLTTACQTCGHQNFAGSEFCTQCKKKLTHTDCVSVYVKKSALEYTPRFLLERAFKYKSSMIGERKLVSVLFADVAAFTTMAEKLDPEDVHEIMDGCFQILGQEIHRTGGTINQYTGDGIMALFGAPIAYDDHIRSACHAALQVQKRMKAFHGKISKDYGVSFKLRIGIHTGPVVVGAIGDNLRLDYTAVGDTTNLAARLESMAEPGTILVSERVFQNAKNHFLFDNGVQRNVKGKKEPIEVFLLIGKKIAKHGRENNIRNGIPFVNREKEIALLTKTFERSVKHGPILTTVTGEAGIGKTSLFKYFQQFVANQKALILEGRCRPYGQLTALFPLKQMFRFYFNIHEQDSDNQIQFKIRNSLNETEPSIILDHLWDLFSGTEKQTEDFHLAIDWKKKALFRTIRDLLVSISKKQPVIMVINDMQWSDVSTREFLTFLTQSPENIPVLIVCMGRSKPELWLPNLPMKSIRLNPLPEKQATHLFTSILKANHFDPNICKKIVSKAGGNPLFLVEMGEALKRQGLIVSKESKCTLKVPVHNIETPESIQGILAARLDALHPELKHLIQLAAVIGQEFSYELLTALIGSPENLSDLLEETIKEGIIEPNFSDNKQVYQFRQPLMQEAAYQSLLRRDRCFFHEIVGKTIEALYPQNLQNNSDLLAHHFYQAKNWPKAFEYILEAMEQASFSYACQEALYSIERALDIIFIAKWEHPDVKRLDLFLRKGKIHFCMGQMDKAQAVFKDLLLEARRLSDRKTEAEALFRLGWISFYTHQPRSSQTLLTEAIHLSRQKDFSDILLKATGFLGFVHAVLGNLKEASNLLMEAFELGDQLDEYEGKAWSLVNLARYYNWIGEFEKTLELCRQLHMLNQEIRSPYFRLLLNFIQGSVYGALGQIEKAKQNLKAGLIQLEGVDDKFWRPRFLNTLGWVYAEIGDYKEAVNLNKQSLEEAKDTGDPEIIHNAQINLGENYMAMNDFSGARDVLEAVWQEVKKPSVSYTRWRYKTRLLIALGELYGRLGDRNKGLVFVRKAMNLAQKSGAKKHQAHALFAKSLLLSQNRPKLIRDSLDQALTLSLEMGTRLLTRKIRQAYENMESF